MSIAIYLSERAPEMATGAILAIPATVHAILAEAGAEVPAWIGSASQISAFGLVAWIVFHMFSTWLPKQQEEHARQLKDQRDAHAIATETIAKAHADAITATSDAFKAALQQQRTDLLALRFVCQASPIKNQESKIPL